MATIVIKSLDDISKLTPLADGKYTLSTSFKFKPSKPDGSPDPNAVEQQFSAKWSLVVAGGKYTIPDSTPAQEYATFDAFKNALKEGFGGNHTESTVTIESVASTSTTAPATSETPWLLIAGAAVLAYVLLKKR
jgi:hypothetical protein